MSEQPIVVHVEFDRIAKFIEEKLESLKNELRSKVSGSGKGEVLPAQEDHRRRIVESLRYGRSIREQWESPLLLPNKPVASLMDYVQKSREIEAGKTPVGSTIYIPVVRDVDADILEKVGDPLTPKDGLYEIVSATVKEAAITTNIDYHAIEQLSEDLLTSIESVFQKALLRAIDKKVLDEMASKNTPIINRSDGDKKFKTEYIADALLEVASQGKELNPQDFILVVNPAQCIDLYKEIASSQTLAFARSDIIKGGVVSEFMGVKILISSYLPSPAEGMVSAFLVHKNSIVLAIQRNIMFETERDTQARKIKLTGSATFAVAVVDPNAICKIITPA